MENAAPKITDYATVEALCDGVPVYSFDHLVYIHGQGPELCPGMVWQDGNTRPAKKITLKKTWDIKNNFVGSCHEMTPRTKWVDSQPHLPIHLIDGDPSTIWSSFECHSPDAHPEWIRIDLPVERPVSEVAITCLWNYMGRTNGFRTRPRWNFGNSMPREVEVRVSRDARQWETVYANNDVPEDADGLRMPFAEPKLAKQIWILARRFTQQGYEGYMFSINGVEVRDPAGNNLALVSKGAGVTVSSVSNHHNSERHSANSLWGPLQYELGNKWTKIGSDNGSSLWCFTELEKGALKVDADLDQAVTDAVRNGINVIMTLDFKGNWLYENPPRKTNWLEARFREINESYLCGVAFVDDSPEMFAGYLRWVEHMANHFKDRVAVFEIGNEWNGRRGDRSVEWYKTDIFEPTYAAIKKAAPNAKIAMGGTAYMPVGELLRVLGPGWDDGRPPVAQRVDGVCWHPADMPDQTYFDKARAFRRECEKFGFRGAYFASEIYAGAAYPPGPDPTGKNQYRMSDIQEAKYLSRSLTGHGALNIEAGSCHVHFTGFPHPQALCRTTWPSQLGAPSQPKPSYYCTRNIATAMDDFYEAAFPVEFSNGAGIIHFPLESGDKKQLMVATWLQAPLADDIAEQSTDVLLPGIPCGKAWVVDTLNGTEQELDVAHENGATVLRGMRIKDYPALIRFLKA